MPILMKSVVIVEQISVQHIGVRYVWADLGIGIGALAARLIGFGHGPEIDRAYRELIGVVKYRYAADSVQDHSIQPRIRSLFCPNAWSISGLLGGLTAGTILAYRAVVGFAPHGRMIPEGLVESALIGLLFFILSLGIRLWMSMRADIMEQVSQERGDTPKGLTFKYIELPNWAEFIANNEATTVSPSAGSPDSTKGR